MSESKSISITPLVIGGVLVVASGILWSFPELVSPEFGSVEYWVTGLLSLGLAIPALPFAIRFFQNRRISKASASATNEATNQTNLNLHVNQNPEQSDSTTITKADAKRLFIASRKQTLEAVLFEMTSDLADRAKVLAEQLLSEDDAKYFRRKHLASIEALSRDLSNLEQFKWFGMAAEQFGTAIAMKKQLFSHSISVLGTHQKKYSALNKATQKDKDVTSNDDYKDLLNSIAAELQHFHRELSSLNQKCHSLVGGQQDMVDILSEDVLRSANR